MKTVTIGEVLNRLKAEFDDVTISKIRFLESEGLISPDRTDSGYRKFTDADVDRLRYVLRAQRDRYLPLKVIREELERLDADGGLVIDPADPARLATVEGAGTALTLDVDGNGDGNGDGDHASGRLTDGGATDVVLTASQIAQRTGLTERHVGELREHGLLGSPPYDTEALGVAQAAARLLRDGLEVRHLRMYRQFADREGGVVEQLIGPLLRQRNPESRAAAVEQAERLMAAGNDLRQLLLSRELRALLTS